MVRWIRSMSLGLFLAAGALSPNASAQDAPAPDPLAPAKKAFEAMCAAKKAAEAAVKKSDHEAKVQAARAAFFGEFKKVAWNEWDIAYDADLLAEGLLMTATLAWRDQDWKGTQKAAEFLIDRVPEHRLARLAMTDLLPDAYDAQGDWDAGAESLRNLLPKLQPADAAMLHLRIGDLHAAAGDVESARKSYARADASFAAVKDKDEPGRARFEFDAQKRKRIGEPVPDVVMSNWIGGKATTFSALSDRTVLLYLFAPHPASYRGDAVKALGAMQQQAGAQALAVVGVTNFLQLSVMSKVKDSIEARMPRGPDDGEGEKVEVARADFPKFLETYRQRMKFKFPVAIASQDEIEKLESSPRVMSIYLIAPGGTILRVFDEFDWRLARGVTLAVCARFAKERAAAAPK